MSKNAFVYDNVSIKKLAFKKRKGTLELKLYDGYYSLVYQTKVNLNDKKEMKKMLTELKSKGFEIFNETSWF